MKKQSTNIRDTKGLTYQQLRKKAQDMGIQRFSQMRKMELAKAIEYHKKHPQKKNNMGTKKSISEKREFDLLKYMVTKYDPEIKATVYMAKNIAVSLSHS